MRQRGERQHAERNITNDREYDDYGLVVNVVTYLRYTFKIEIEYCPIIIFKHKCIIKLRVKEHENHDESKWIFNHNIFAFIFYSPCSRQKK